MQLMLCKVEDQLQQRMSHLGQQDNTAVRRQTAVTAYLKSRVTAV